MTNICKTLIRSSKHTHNASLQTRKVPSCLLRRLTGFIEPQTSQSMNYTRDGTGDGRVQNHRRVRDQNAPRYRRVAQNRLGLRRPIDPRRSGPLRPLHQYAVIDPDAHQLGQGDQIRSLNPTDSKLNRHIIYVPDDGPSEPERIRLLHVVPYHRSVGLTIAMILGT